MEYEKVKITEQNIRQLIEAEKIFLEDGVKPIGNADVILLNYNTEKVLEANQAAFSDIDLILESPAKTICITPEGVAV